MGQVRLNQGDIVLIPIPFSNLSGSKVRPAFIISNNTYNTKSEDVIVCGVTSNIKNITARINLSDADLQKGSFGIQSQIALDTIHKIDVTMIRKVIGTAKKSYVESVKNKFFELF